MFGYLNVHSHYSLLRGVAKVSSLLDVAKKENCDALGLTDTNNMYGAIEFYKKAKDVGIQPILGVTLHTHQGDESNRYPIVLLAKNKKGYQSILKLISHAQYATGATPYITFEQAEKFSDDVIALLPSLHNSVQQFLLRDDEENAERYLKQYQKIYNENFYVGISPQDPTPRNETKIPSTTDSMVELAKKIGVETLPLPLIYLLNKEDAEARDVLLRIQKTNQTSAEENLFEDLLLFPKQKSITEWAQTEYPQTLQTLDKIITQAKLDLELGSWVFPTPPQEHKKNYQEILLEYVEEGFRNRNIKKTKEIEDRVAFEMDVITSRKYTEYFLSVIDLIQYMHKNNILTTTRGSAAGSMVSYLTGITNINPIEYQLPFERFLNPYRPSAPDIDMDIADNRRGEVIEYITKRFGKDKVAQIGTLGTMMARAAVRDTARALGYSYLTGDRIARLIPLGVQGMPMYIDKALQEVKELQTLYDSDETVKHIINVAKKIEGNARHISVHAAGVVISPSPVVDYTPLEKDHKGVSNRPVTQYNMHAIEDAGLLKFDILGLTNLAILADAVVLVKKDKQIDIDVEKLVFDDEATYKMIGDGYTTGVFQLGGTGMTAVLKRMKPQNIYDIAAIIALYRPGPMQNIDEYIDRKQGKKDIIYPHPKMEKFLKNSYGVLVYQDDLLYTAIEIAGYTWEEVDVFRKAVGKKIPELMAKQEKIFKERAKKQSNLSEQQATRLWESFEPFKGYGFNKAHAMSYAKVAYQTAYMKANYPAQYMTVHLSAAGGDLNTVAELIYESKRLNLHILPPEINESEVLFSTEKNNKDQDCIRIGLATIKQVGSAIAEAIINEREKNGKYKTLEDFITRIAPSGIVNKRNIEALIKVGVLDIFERREVLLENIKLLLLCSKDCVSSENQSALFPEPKAVLTLQSAKSKLSKIQQLSWEKDLLGTYISGHPLDMFEKDGLDINDIKLRKQRTKIYTTAIISNLNPFRNKSGKKMCFLTLEDDMNNKIDAVCFPDEVEKYEELLAANRPIQVRGITTKRNEEITIKIDTIENPKIRQTV